MTIDSHTSPARVRLAEMIDARDEIAAAADRILASLKRLADAQKGAEPIQDELSRLNAAETQAFRVWSTDPDATDAPVPDRAKRADIMARLIDARTTAEGAQRAEAGLQADYTRAADRLRPIGAPLRAAVAEVLVEEAQPLIREFEELNREVSGKSSRLRIVSDMIYDLARMDPDINASRPLYNLAESFVGQLAKIIARPAEDDDLASIHRMGWRNLADALSKDATATLNEAA